MFVAFQSNYWNQVYPRSAIRSLIFLTASLYFCLAFSNSFLYRFCAVDVVVGVSLVAPNYFLVSTTLFESKLTLSVILQSIASDFCPLAVMKLTTSSRLYSGNSLSPENTASIAIFRSSFWSRPWKWDKSWKSKFSQVHSIRPSEKSL